MRTTAIAIGFAASVVFAAGCHHNSNSTASAAGSSSTSAVQSASSSNATPEQLGAIGAQIKKHPKEANKILADHGMDQASFEKAIRAVSSSPDASRRYRDAYRRAGA